MKIFYINNIGSGFANEIEVPEGTTLGQFFTQQMPGHESADYLIRLNRQPAAHHEPLTPGCRISITPTKIEGAIH